MSAMMIMIAMMVALLLLVFVLAARNQRPQLPLQRPALVDEEALTDAELQSYLPGRKIEAIKRYRMLTGVGLKEAKDVIEWAIQNPVIEGKIKGVQKARPAILHENGIHLDALRDPELQSHLLNNKIEAIRRYRELTGVGLKEAKDAVEWLEKNPDTLEAGKEVLWSVDTQGAGVRDLVVEGRIEEAVRVYAAFMGVDSFSARDAVEQIQREMRLDDPADTSSLGDLLSGSGESASRKNQ